MAILVVIEVQTANALSVGATILVGKNPSGIAYDPANGEMFVINQHDATISIISDATNAVVNTVADDNGPSSITYDPVKGEMFIANSGNNTVSVISNTKNVLSLVATVTVGKNPSGMAYDSAKGEMFVTNSNDNTISIISDKSNTVVGTVTVGDNPNGIAYDPAKGEMFVTNSGTYTVSIISDKTNTVVDTVNVGNNPNGIAYDSAKGEMFVANSHTSGFQSNTSTVSIISDSTDTIVGTVVLNSLTPIDVVYDPVDGEMFVANYDYTNTVSIISDKTNAVVDTVDVGSRPSSIAYDPTNGNVFVTNDIDNDVSVIFTSTKTSDQQSTEQCGISKVDCYKESGFRLTSNPVICMSIPPVSSHNMVVTNANAIVASSISEWSSLLNQGDTSHISLWKIQLMPTPTSDVCNITLDFLEKPSLSDSQVNYADPIGVTIYDFENHHAHIHVYFDKVASQYHDVNCAALGNGSLECDNTIPSDQAILTKTWYTTYYADELAPDYQLQFAIRHELGHAFGLGHYITSNDENQKWVSGKTDAPSIMVPSIPLEGVYQFSISPNDISQLKSLYDNDGFGENTSTTQIPTPSTPPVTPVVPSSTTASIPSWVKNNAKYWSNGDLEDSDFVKGIQYMIGQKIISIPPTTQGASSQNTIPNWVKKDAQFWANGDMNDNDFVKAIQFLVKQGIIKLS